MPTPNDDVTKYAYKERSNAFYIDADNIECYNCKILSSQDTLGRNGSKNCNYHTYFNNCVIGGNVDYICGEFSAAFGASLFTESVEPAISVFSASVSS